MIKKHINRLREFHVDDQISIMAQTTFYFVKNICKIYSLNSLLFKCCHATNFNTVPAAIYMLQNNEKM